MGEFCEFEIDFNQFDDLRAVVVHDECGAHEDVWFYRLDGLKAENAKLRGLLVDCHALLQRCCDKEDKHGCDCPMWPDHGDECDLRKVERRMRELGIEVDG